MTESLPLLLRAARGESVSRPPVWMMRQAGRYMKVYRELRDKYPSFRDRSENPELSYEISMQPFLEFQPDGVILFSDILTPLPGMGIDFAIVESKGPLIQNPIQRSDQDLRDITHTQERKTPTHLSGVICSSRPAANNTIQIREKCYLILITTS